MMNGRASGSGSEARETRFSMWEYAAKFRSGSPGSADGERGRLYAGAIDAGTKPLAVRPMAENHRAVRSPSWRLTTGSGDDNFTHHVCSHEEFMSIVEDMRAFLVENRAETEEEQIQYGTALNRAVLGYARERQAFMAIIQDRLAALRLHHLRPLSAQYETMSEAVFAEVIGMNVLESVLKERENLEEVQVIGTRIFEVRSGRSRRSPYSFRSVEEVERLQQNLVLYNRDAINTRKRWAEVSLPDGSRVTMTGFGYTREPTITIRFFPLSEATLDSLIGEPYDTLDSETAMLLKAIVAARLNLVVIGATNTGKSHLLKALISVIPDDQRIVTIEQRCELQLSKIYPDKNIVEFEAPDDDPLHNGEQAFRLALRQSPERIILAEIRDQEANLYVRACTRGHMGSMTTAHVNTLEDVPDAITDMCMLDKRGMNPDRLRRRIARFVTQIGIEMRNIGGKRRIVRIGEIIEQDGHIEVRDLVRYDHKLGSWLKVQPLDKQFSEHIRRHCPEHYDALRAGEWITP